MSRPHQRTHLPLSALLIGFLFSGPLLLPVSDLSMGQNAGHPLLDSTLPHKRVASFFKKYCLDCHAGDSAEADFDLTAFAGIDKPLRTDSQIDQGEQIFKKIAAGEMPPSDADQPARQEKTQIANWIKSKIHNAGRIPEWERKLLYPEYGNYVDHLSLFDGTNRQPGWSPSRLWKKSPYIFDSLVVRGIGFRAGRYGRPPGELSKVKQPFTIEEKSGILDYARVQYADVATLETMLRNAETIVDQHLAGAMHELQERVNGPLPMDQWPKNRQGKPVKPRFPKTVPEFKSIILKDGAPDAKEIEAAIEKMFGLLIERGPTSAEINKYRKLAKSCIDQAGQAEGLRTVLIAIAISPPAIYRSELGAGPADEYGRKMLSPIELGYAIAYALTDQKPDAELAKAIQNEQLRTRSDARREVIRILNDPRISKPRILRFFQEFFGYHYAPKVFKDAARFKGDYRGVAQKLVDDCDTLVKHIVSTDKQVFSRLLSSEEYFVAHNGDNAANQQTVESLRKFYDYLKDKNWRDFPYQTPKEHKQKIVAIDRMFTHANGNVVKRWMNYLTMCDQNGLTPIPLMNGRQFISLYNLDEKSFSFPVQQPFTLAQGNRVGILMHPAWLLAHSLNLDNDPVRRGKFIRERLLAGTVPDLPITVDAQIPDSPDQPLRQRFTVTRQAECWRCHVKMNPLGMPFERFDDFGRYRTVEALHSGNTAPVRCDGFLDGTLDAALDGQVKDPVDLMRRLARSERVRQSFIRHAFRYWLGRNEMLSDSSTLMDADQAYLKNEGSFKAVLISLLTSDSFLYRKDLQPLQVK